MRLTGPPICRGLATLRTSLALGLTLGYAPNGRTRTIWTRVLRMAYTAPKRRLAGVGAIGMKYDSSAPGKSGPYWNRVWLP
jgi:hypothetical protein